MNDKKITIMFILIATFSLLGIVGFTIAYFTSLTDFENEFNTGIYQTEAVETFTSPDDWIPGTTTPKTLTITNTGNVDVKARVCISEEWLDASNYTLSNKVYGESMAIINLDNTSDWTRKGACFEYNQILEPNDTTSSFISGVTFNPNAEASLNCTTTSSNGTRTKACSSSGHGYDDATYILTLTVETIQADVASSIWTTTTKYAFNDFYLFLNDYIPNELTLYDTLDDLIEDRMYPFGLKYTIYNNSVVDALVVFRVTEEIAASNNWLTTGDYTLRGGVDESDLVSKPIFEANKAMLLGLYGSSHCDISNESISCHAYGGPDLYADIHDNGYVSAYDDSDWYCTINDYGYSICGM